MDRSESQEFLAQTPLELFVGGRWLGSSDAKTFQRFDPGTGEVLAEVYQATPEDLGRAVDSAGDAFRQRGWSQLAPSERAVYLQGLADLVEARQSVIAEIESLDVGKPLAQAQWDVQNFCQTSLFCPFLYPASCASS
jgi:acyl-CoA reductase-like NAD-dependent aldehyde dehydrogenase